VRATDAKTAKKQDRMNSFNRAVVCCDCNRPSLDTIEGAGFCVTSLEHTELPKAPSFARPAILGAALASTSSGLGAASTASANTTHRS
jgi:hypothetical protein